MAPAGRGASERGGSPAGSGVTICCTFCPDPTSSVDRSEHTFSPPSPLQRATHESPSATRSLANATFPPEHRKWISLARSVLNRVSKPAEQQGSGNGNRRQPHRVLSHTWNREASRTPPPPRGPPRTTPRDASPTFTGSEITEPGGRNFDRRTPRVMASSLTHSPNGIDFRPPFFVSPTCVVSAAYAPRASPHQEPRSPPQ